MTVKIDDYEVEPPLHEQYQKQAFSRMGIVDPHERKTAVLSATRECDLPRHMLWETWCKLEEWPVWSRVTHQSTRWVGKPGWSMGCVFEQELQLGFPFGLRRNSQRVKAVVPMESVQWSWKGYGIQFQHLWVFEEQPGNRSRVTSTEIYTGGPIVPAKFFLYNKWRYMVGASVQGLVRHAYKKAEQAGHVVQPSLPGFVEPETEKEED
jgi:hypothetical protein